MTFLEVVFATALFAIVASSILGVFGFTVSAAHREQKLLACAEVANRLILQYMDDPTQMPDTNKPVEYGPPEAPMMFRWDYQEDPITLVEPKGDTRERIRESPLRHDRFVQVTVKVWLSETSGGSRAPDAMTPQFVLSRMYDPTYLRNPDSFMHMLMNPKGQATFLEVLQGKMKLREGSGGGRGRSERLNRTREGGVEPRQAFGRSRGERGVRRMTPRSDK